MSETSYCRTCLSVQNLIPIFSNDKTAESRSKDLFLVTGVAIQLNDEFSQLICKTCNNVIKDTLKLRVKSQNSDKTLRSQTVLKNIAKPDILRTEKCLPNTKKRFGQKLEIVDKEQISIEKEEKELIANRRIVINTVKNKHKAIENSLNSTVKRKIAKQQNSHSKCLIENKKSVNAKGMNKIIDSNSEIDHLDIEVDIDNLKQEVFVENLNEIDVECDDSVENVNRVDSDVDLPAEPEKEGKQDDINIIKEDKKEVKCKRKRLSKEELQKYLSLAVQPVSKGPVRCLVCGVQLRERRFFINHAKTHFEAQHVCECGKRFTQHNALRYHRQRVHGAARRLSCCLCPYSAVDRASLENHTRAVHTGERPYTCDVCGDTFRVRATIVQHMRSHFATYDVQVQSGWYSQEPSGEGPSDPTRPAPTHTVH